MTKPEPSQIPPSDPASAPASGCAAFLEIYALHLCWGAVTVVELTGRETEEECKDIAWKMFCNAHPVEAYQHNPDGFWKYFHARAPQMTREQMVALLKECEEPESESLNAALSGAKGNHDKT